MDSRKIRLLVWTGVMMLCLLAVTQCRRSGEGVITGIVWSPDGRLIYALAWHEDGLTSLVRLNPETAMAGERMQIFAVPPT